MTTVIHSKREKHAPNYIYIGRPSKWGNPFEIGKHGDREAVIRQYRQWITAGEGKHLLADLHELKGKQLGCWCKPLACHGDVLAELTDASGEGRVDMK